MSLYVQRNEEVISADWRIELDTDKGRIALSAQQKELSEGSGILGSGPLKIANWHRANLDATLAALKALPGRKEEIA